MASHNKELPFPTVYHHVDLSKYVGSAAIDGEGAAGVLAELQCTPQQIEATNIVMMIDEVNGDGDITQDYESETSTIYLHPLIEDAPVPAAYAQPSEAEQEEAYQAIDEYFVKRSTELSYDLWYLLTYRAVDAGYKSKEMEETRLRYKIGQYCMHGFTLAVFGGGMYAAEKMEVTETNTGFAFAVFGLLGFSIFLDVLGSSESHAREVEETKKLVDKLADSVASQAPSDAVQITPPNRA
jgi:hypothetical protein